jgi:hypothetical protein
VKDYVEEEKKKKKKKREVRRFTDYTPASHPDFF